MKIIKLWVEYEDEHKETYLRPATNDDLEYFINRRQKTYMQEEIAALR